MCVFRPADSALSPLGLVLYVRWPRQVQSLPVRACVRLFLPALHQESPLFLRAG